MPQITKARIVNFKYNNGKRIIADELYDFTNENIACDTLINLINGGGKTIIVQLLMQPMCPKAKVAGRRIESYFTKSSDHCFILLEWSKDNSPEKLLTGIAMAGSDTSAGEDDTQRGITVKYYTFYSNYSDYKTDYNIINIPLSEKGENGMFIPAEFDRVRKLAKSSNGALCYYASDDGLKWKKKLAEYGISREEWEMIVKLNAEEGGLGKFFGNFVSSDKLLNDLLIPITESKLTHHGRGNDDDSLTTMLIAYARQYAMQKEVLEEKKSYENLVAALQALDPKAKSLWEANYALEECIQELFGFATALNAKLIECREAQEKFEEENAYLDHQKERVEFEQISAAYHKAKAEFDKALDAYNQAKSEEETLSEEHAREYHKRLVLECANYYQTLCRVNGDLRAIQTQIDSLENDREDNPEITALKYSIFVQVTKLQEKYLCEQEELKTKHQEISQEIESCRENIAANEKAWNETKAKYDRASGSLSSLMAEADRKIEKYSIDLARRIDGMLEKEDIKECLQISTKKQTEFEENLLRQQNQIQLLNAELASLPQKLADISIDISKHKASAEAAQKALEAYKVAESRIYEICREYAIDFTLRFTDRIQNFLVSERERNQASRDEILRKIAVVEEEIVSAKRGSLHIPNAVIQYLNATGIRYTTCEKYLTNLVAEGKLSNEKCIEVLQGCPAVAFGVLIEEKEKDKLFASEREQWLPAMVPLFTYQQMERVLRCEFRFDDAIAFFSEEFFTDISQYIEKLEQAQINLLQQKDLLTATGKRLDNQLEIVKAFTYNDGYAVLQQNVIEQEEANIAKLEEMMEALKAQKEELLRKQNNANQLVSETQNLILSGKRVLEIIAEITELAAEEMSLRDITQESAKTMSSLKQERLTSEKTRDELEKQLNILLERVANNQSKLKELEEILTRIGNCPETELIHGDWKELWQQYHALNETMSQELSVLQRQREDKLSQKQLLEKELEARSVDLEEYREAAFSEGQLIQTRERVKSLAKRKEDASSELRYAAEAMGRTEGVLENRRQALEDREPLEIFEIGTDFARRLTRIQEEKKEINAKLARYRKLENRLESLSGRLRDKLREYTCPESSKSVLLEDDCNTQFEQMNTSRIETEKAKRIALQAVEQAIENMRAEFESCVYGALGAVKNIERTLHSEAVGDKYFTLTEVIQEAIKTSQLMIAKIETDLSEFVNSRSDLVRQCSLQGERVYKGLSQMAASSRVYTYTGAKSKTQMIRFNMPANIDPVIAEQAIADEVDKAAREITVKMADGESDESVRKRAAYLVGSQNLLRKYIGKEKITVEGYKVDRIPQNSHYRTWEETLISNSGAEKFIVYFSIIVSLMNYTRGDIGSIQDKDLRSVLILDNPFGTTSSDHVLMPVFELAKHFHVQLICVSDIDKSAIIRCFNNVIRAVVKRRAMSTNEILTHDGNELIEHGYYQSKQISIF